MRGAEPIGAADVVSLGSPPSVPAEDIVPPPPKQRPRQRNTGLKP